MQPNQIAILVHVTDILPPESILLQSNYAKETILWNDPGLHKFLANFAYLSTD